MIYHKVEREEFHRILVVQMLLLNFHGNWLEDPVLLPSHKFCPRLDLLGEGQHKYAKEYLERKNNV